MGFWGFGVLGSQSHDVRDNEKLIQDNTRDNEKDNTRDNNEVDANVNTSDNTEVVHTIDPLIRA